MKNEIIKRISVINNCLNKVTMNKQMLKKTRSWMLALLVLSMAACNDDNDGDINLDDQEVESAVLLSLRTQSPSGVVYYMNVFEDFPEEVQVNNLIELGEDIRVHSFGEHPYVWNGDASTMTKWNVDKTDLSLSQASVMSLAGVGISGDFGPPVFSSETQAYFFALTEGKVVEFNPTEMTITNTHEVTPITFSGLANGAWYDVWDKYVSGDKVIMSIGFYPGSNWDIPSGATTAVFDITTNSVTYNTDERLLAGYETMVVDESGTIYQYPSYEAGAAKHYGNHTDAPSTFTMLKVNADGTYDPSFMYDFSTVLNSININTVQFIFDNQAVVHHTTETSWPDDPEGRWDFSNLDQSKFVIVDMNDNTVSDFTALDKYRSTGYNNIIDGSIHINARVVDDNGNITGYLLRQNAIDNYTEVAKFVGGPIRYSARLW